MNDVTLTLTIVAMAFFALLSRPSIRAQFDAAFDSSSQVAVARTICRAETDVGGDRYEPCVHRLIPNMPAGLTNMPERR